MNNRYITEYHRLLEEVTILSNNGNLPGLTSQGHVESFVKQLIDSIKRNDYIFFINSLQFSEQVTDPNSPAFNPIKAVSYYISIGDHEEAIWLIFLIIHFGKNKRYSWNLLRNVYGGLSNRIWSFDSIQSDFEEFSLWIERNAILIKQNANYGNHRKYESIHQCPLVFRSYINLMGGSQFTYLNDISIAAENANLDVFDELYRHLRIYRFDRIGKFDFLCMLFKFGIIAHEPRKIYVEKATGPKIGSKLLFFNNRNDTSRSRIINANIEDLSRIINHPLKMQILEDAICNWQKSPNVYLSFR